MSGVGLTADLELDIARALDSVTELESALSAATTGIAVELDLAGVSAFSDAISEAVAAVAAEPVDLTVDADASAVTDEVDAAIEATDSTVVVDADASSVPPVIEDAVAAADPEPVVIEADVSAATAEVAELGGVADETSGSLSGLGGDMTGLNAAAGLAQGSVSELVQGVGKLPGGAGAAASGLGVLGAATGALFANALDAEASTFRLNQQLGDLASLTEEINVGNLSIGLEDLAVKLGSSDEAIRDTISSLVQLGDASGATKTEAEATAEQFVALAARAVALNPELGDVGEVADNLARVMASGRTRGLIPFGISLNAAEIQARALQDTGKAAVTDLNRFELAAAGAAIATENFGDHLQQDIDQGAENPLLKLRSLRTRLDEAIEAAGKPLVIPILDLLEAGEPTAELFGEVLGNLATAVIPLLTSSLEALAPTLEVTAGVLESIAPIIEAVAFVMDLLPPGIAAAVVGFFAFRAALTALAEHVVATGVVMSGLNPIIAGLAVVGAIAAGIMGSQSEGHNQVQEAADREAAAMSDLSVSVGEHIRAAVEAHTKTGQLAEALNDAEQTTDGLRYALIGGQDSLQSFAEVTLAAADAAGKSKGEQVKLAFELQALGTAYQAAADRTLDKAVADGLLSQADRDAAESTRVQSDGTVNYLSVLSDLQPALAAATVGTDGLTTAERDSAEATQAASKAIQDLNKDMLDLVDQTLSTFTAALQLSDAQIAGRTAIEEYTKATQDSTTTADQLTSATNKALEASISGAEAARDAAKAQVEASGATFTSADANNALIGELSRVRDTLAPGSPLRVQLDQYIAGLGAIPSDVHTEAQIDVDDAVRRWHEYINLLKTTPYQIETIANVRGTDARKGGGPVWGGEGVWVGEAGREWFTPPGDGWILPHEQSESLAASVGPMSSSGTSSIDPDAIAAAIARALGPMLTQRGGPLFQIDNATFGSEGAAEDVEWMARTRLVGI